MGRGESESGCSFFRWFVKAITAIRLPLISREILWCAVRRAVSGRGRPSVEAGTVAGVVSGRWGDPCGISPLPRGVIRARSAHFLEVWRVFPMSTALWMSKELMTALPRPGSCGGGPIIRVLLRSAKNRPEGAAAWHTLVWGPHNDFVPAGSQIHKNVYTKSWIQPVDHSGMAITSWVSVECLKELGGALLSGLLQNAHVRCKMRSFRAWAAPRPCIMGSDQLEEMLVKWE